MGRHMTMNIMTTNMITDIRMKRMVTIMGRKRTDIRTRTVRIMGMNKNMGTPTITDTITNTAIPMATTTNRASKIPLMPPSSTSAACRTCAAS